MRVTRGGIGRRTAAAVLAGTVLVGGGVLVARSGSEDGGTDTTVDAAEGSGDRRAPGPGPRTPGDGDATLGGEHESAQRGERSADPYAPDTAMRSTFALDVDTASYSYARRQLREGTLPMPGSVRPEEFVNSFRQEHRRPGGNGFAVSMDGARTTDEEWTLLRVGLATRPETEEERSRGPASLTFVVDVSGSMSEPGRLDLVKHAMRTMVGRLRSDDALSIVAFSDEAETVLPMTKLGGERQRDRARTAIAGLETRSSTNLQAGLGAGYRQAVDGRRAGATNRVVLLSDALANTGATDADSILEDIGRARREHGVTLFGVGVGSHYGDTLMESLTNRGDGNTVYVADREEAARVFSRDLARNIEVRARDAKAQVAFDRGNVEQYRLIGYDNRRVANEDFRDDRVDGGEVGPGHTVTALYAVKLRDGAAGRVATTTVRWLDPKSRRPDERSGRISAAELDGELWKDGSPRLRTAAVATYFADALRVGAAHHRDGAPDEAPSVHPPGTRRDDPGNATRAPGASTRGPGTPLGGSRPLPGDPGLSALHKEAVRAARDTEDKDVQELARLIGTSRDLAG
ncbi:von Willebrand factor type A domain-containing protein [Streptomyces sp. P38-E01]|uniref:von Willebrand factor type A domain-containing protein n=1 Tax=Streptomyces tardus TaxID=2780544 RepID=A0A949N8S3_9ACTN|nr:von Willebrand factor type A domain-containing protein [Streptomyces tardus]MBU7598866.1 von Willebrand factor type A domain-containing protein [Streptomyces tardus]